MEQDTLNNKLDEFGYQLKDLEKQCHFFHMQIEKMTNIYTMVQQHELKLYDLENDLKKNL